MTTWDSLRTYLIRKKGDTIGERVLGSIQEVDYFSVFWKQHNQGLVLSSASLLHAFVAKNSFTPEEYKMYKRGVSDMVNFFRQCDGEREERLEQGRLKQKKAKKISNL